MSVTPVRPPFYRTDNRGQVSQLMPRRGYDEQNKVRKLLPAIEVDQGGLRIGRMAMKELRDRVLQELESDLPEEKTSQKEVIAWEDRADRIVNLAMVTSELAEHVYAEKKINEAIAAKPRENELLLRPEKSKSN